MSNFLYFLPGEKLTKRTGLEARLKAFGLGHVWRQDGTIEWVGTDRGPDGNSGSVIGAVPGDGGERARCGYYPDTQTWHGPDSDGEKAWIGIETLTPPGPADVQRQWSDLITGQMVRLGDGEQWLIPTARLFKGGTLLPRILTEQSDGTIKWALKPEFSELAGLADRVFWAVVAAETQSDGKEDEISLGDMMRAARLALAVNYRVGRREIAIMGLMDDVVLHRVCLALADVGAFKDWLLAEAKKKASLSESTDGSGS